MMSASAFKGEGTACRMAIYLEQRAGGSCEAGGQTGL